MFENVVMQFVALAGFAALISVIVNILKVVGVVKDDKAQLWVGGANLLGILVMYGFKLLKPEYDFASLDPLMMEIATVASFILAYVMQLGVSKLTYFITKGMPGIGHSYSLTAAKAAGQVR